MQRRMMKALQDLSVHYDATVRTSSGRPRCHARGLDYGGGRHCVPKVFWSWTDDPPSPPIIKRAQFAYGDDGLDPAFMEENGRPVDFARLSANAALPRGPIKTLLQGGPGAAAAAGGPGAAAPAGGPRPAAAQAKPPRRPAACCCRHRCCRWLPRG